MVAWGRISFCHTYDGFRIEKSIRLWTSKRISCVFCRPVSTKVPWMGVIRPFWEFDRVRRGYKSEAMSQVALVDGVVRRLMCVSH